jgi:hypothetical protein
VLALFCVVPAPANVRLSLQKAFAASGLDVLLYGILMQV